MVRRAVVRDAGRTASCTADDADDFAAAEQQTQKDATESSTAASERVSLRVKWSMRTCKVPLSHKMLHSQMHPAGVCLTLTVLTSAHGCDVNCLHFHSSNVQAPPAAVASALAFDNALSPPTGFIMLRLLEVHRIRRRR